MRILAGGTETFLFLNGLSVPRPLRLSEHVELLPAVCSPDPDAIIKLARTEVDLGVMTIFLRSVTSQLRISAETPKEVAVRAWNALWDAVLLGALYQCEAACNFQSDRSAESFGPESALQVTNYHLRGLTNPPVRMIDDAEAVWIEQHFERARTMLDEEALRGAVHSLASYRWHSHPRAQLALLWSGIEGLFGVESELVFRVSLYAARVLEPDDTIKRKQIFDSVKRLYRLRSVAVHGAEMKGDARGAVEESAQLLLKLVHQCVLADHPPRIKELAP